MFFPPMCLCLPGQWTYVNPSGAMYNYDFSTLCDDANDYVVNDTTGHS